MSEKNTATYMSPDDLIKEGAERSIVQVEDFLTDICESITEKMLALMGEDYYMDLAAMLDGMGSNIRIKVRMVQDATHGA